MSFSDDCYWIDITPIPITITVTIDMGIIPIQCPKCQHNWLDNYTERYNQLCEKCNIMKTNEPSRFGRLKQDFGDFGELREQKKEPKLQVYYLPVKVVNEKEIRAGKTEILRSVNNTPSEVINNWIMKVGQNLEAGNLKREYAEIILDCCYAELNKRLNP